MTTSRRGYVDNSSFDSEDEGREGRLFPNWYQIRVKGLVELVFQSLVPESVDISSVSKKLKWGRCEVDSNLHKADLTNKVTSRPGTIVSRGNTKVHTFFIVWREFTSILEDVAWLTLHTFLEKWVLWGFSSREMIR